MRTRNREPLITASQAVDEREMLEPLWDCAVASMRQVDLVTRHQIEAPGPHLHEIGCTLSLVDRAMVFADLADFSKLADAQIPAFLEFFARALATAAVALPMDAQIQVCGDEVFAVTENARDVLRYAFILNRTLAKGRFGNGQSQRSLKARIALHAGRVVLAPDPATGLPSHHGRNVNLAARLERVTEPGHVFATSDFIEQLNQEKSLPCADLRSNAPEWATRYLGTLCLPKNFGFQAVYEILESGCLA